MNRVLLVCSGGGHLKQLFTLAGRIGIPAERQLWVTFDNGLSRSLLEGRATIFAPFTAPRDAYNFAKLRVLASAMLAHTPFDAAISTGSSPAVAFLPLAAKKGIPSYYIESATRSMGPSLSGKLISRRAAVHTFTQYPGWADARWQYRGSIFDAWEAHPATVPHPVRRAVVTVGTQEGYPFDRFFGALAPLLADADDVLWQTGPQDVSRFGITGRASVPHAEMQDAIARADVVISHAGTGSALTALEAGKVPVLVPRRAAHHEHVDDHQVQIADELARRGLAVVAAPESLSRDLLADAAGRSVRTVKAPPFVIDALDTAPAS